MKFEAHCARCKLLLGDEFQHVNHWIDQLAWVPGTGWEGVRFDPGHRKYRHNHQGIEEVRRRWGDEAAEAAKLHILDDFFGPCPHTEAQEKQIPLDEKDYLVKGWH